MMWHSYVTKNTAAGGIALTCGDKTALKLRASRTLDAILLGIRWPEGADVVTPLAGDK